MRTGRIIEALSGAADAVAQRRTGRPLNVCPHCDSDLVQPLSWKERHGGRIQLELRCPECLAYMAGTFSAERVRDLDRTLSDGRNAVRDAYRDVVASNMRDTLAALTAGFQHDLIGADDFAR